MWGCIELRELRLVVFTRTELHELSELRELHCVTLSCMGCVKLCGLC